MPVVATMNLPKTTDEHEFEDMVADALSQKYNATFQTFGRRGQKQYGVDVLSNTNADIVAQCKNYALTATDIDRIIDEFALEQGIKNFIIATSMDRDTHLQIYVQNINAQRNYSFIVTMMFWDEIAPYIAQTPVLYTKYYGGFVYNVTDINDIKRLFNEGIQKHHILDFLMRDIFVDGVPIDLPTEAEAFTCEMKALLQENLLLQKEPIYKFVLDFCDALDSLNGYLGLNLIPAQNSQFYRYIPNYNIDEDKRKREIQNNITVTIKEMDRVFGNINLGMTLFP